MTRRLIIPEGLRDAAESAAMSPAIAANGLIFLTGITGGDAQGRMPDAEMQIAVIFDKAAQVLAAADLTLDAVVEMTTYHVNIDGHFDAFDAARQHRFAAPYPAWTAVEVARLRRPGAVLEMRLIAAETS